jgi:hypothetical protein
MILAQYGRIYDSKEHPLDTLFSSTKGFYIISLKKKTLSFS